MLRGLTNPCGLIFCLQASQAQYFARTFAFRPLCSQYFTDTGEGGGGYFLADTSQNGN